MVDDSRETIYEDEGLVTPSVPVRTIKVRYVFLGKGDPSPFELESDA